MSAWLRGRELERLAAAAGVPVEVAQRVTEALDRTGYVVAVRRELEAVATAAQGALRLQLDEVPGQPRPPPVRGVHRLRPRRAARGALLPRLQLPPAAGRSPAMSFGRMYRAQVVGLASMGEHELERAIERAIEKAHDAYGYSGRHGAAMYVEELEGLLLERMRRRGVLLERHEPRPW